MLDIININIKKIKGAISPSLPYVAPPLLPAPSCSVNNNMMMMGAIHMRSTGVYNLEY